MLIPTWIYVLHASSHDGRQHGERTSPADLCLPLELQAAVPSCAFSCLQTFILNNYYDNSCSSTLDLANLCRSSTYSGLTIGEGSLQCVISACLNVNLETESGYNICDGIEGARPNTATTITATISPQLSSATSTTIASTANTVASQAPTSVTTSSSEQSITASTLDTTATSNLASSTQTVSSQTDISGSSDAFTSSTTSTQQSSLITSTRSATSTLSATRSATNSATAAAATEGAKREQLSNGAIAGIATAAAVLFALVIAYLAYLCFVKRRNYRKPESRRSSIWLPPHYDTPYGTLTSPTSGQDSGAPQSNAMNNIGVALGASRRISQIPVPAPLVTRSRQDPWPAPAVTRVMGGVAPANESRWSVATSFAEDAEIQNQDVPILGSPRTRSSARSFSSVTIERPPPLRLSRMRSRAESPPTTKIPLTPTYDNGTFEPTIRQVIDDSENGAPIVRRSSDQQAPNFSRREPSLGRTSHDDSRPFWSQNRRPSERFPVKSNAYIRKQSQTSNQSISVYTDIEEDDTPETEENKQLQTAPDPPLPAVRTPLKDLQYPRVPRSASLAKQAEKPHSPRAVPTVRPVDPFLDVTPPKQRSFYNPHTSSSSDMQSASSASPVFPTPPPRVRRRAPSQSQADLVRQISYAYKSASRPTTATTPIGGDNSLPRYPPVPQQPGTMYQQIQRLGTGRPLAQKLQSQGYMPRTSSRPISRARFTPMPGQNGDMYFRLS